MALARTMSLYRDITRQSIKQERRAIMAVLPRLKLPQPKWSQPSPQPTPDSSEAAATVSNWTLTRRMFGLAWVYRWGCVKILLIQIGVLNLGLMALGLFGMGVDFIRSQLDSEVKAPNFPFGLQPPPDIAPLSIVTVIAIAMLVLALARAGLTYIYTIATNYLVRAEIVVDLRAQVYAKLQRISFRFFDSNESGSIINRVRAMCKMCVFLWMASSCKPLS